MSAHNYRNWKMPQLHLFKKDVVSYFRRLGHVRLPFRMHGFFSVMRSSGSWIGDARSDNFANHPIDFPIERITCIKPNDFLPVWIAKIPAGELRRLCAYIPQSAAPPSWMIGAILDHPCNRYPSLASFASCFAVHSTCDNIDIGKIRYVLRAQAATFCLRRSAQPSSSL